MELAAEMAESIVHNIDLLMLTLQEQSAAKVYRRELAVLKEAIESLRANLLDSRVSATMSPTDAASRDRAGKVIAALYDVEHFVDRIHADTEHQRGSSSLLGLPVQRIVDSFLNYKLSASKVRDMRKTFETQVADYASLLRANTSDLERRRGTEETHSSLSAAYLVGRKSERNAINRLLAGDHFSAVLIHGKEDLGKTIVAQLVCLRSQVFDHCFWVWVGNELNPSSVISKVQDAVSAQIQELRLKTTPGKLIPSKPPATTFTEQIRVGQSGATLSEQMPAGQIGTTLSEQIPAGQLDSTLTEKIPVGQCGTTLTKQIPAGQPDTADTEKITVGQSDTTLTEQIPMGQPDTAVTKTVPVGQSDPTLTEQIPAGQADTADTQQIPVGQSGATLTEQIPVGQSDTTPTEKIPAEQSGATLTLKIPAGQSATTPTQQIPPKQLDTTLTQKIPAGKSSTTPTEQIPAEQSDTTLTQKIPVGQSGATLTEQIPAGQSDTTPTDQIPAEQSDTTLTQKIPVGQSSTNLTEQIPAGQSGTTLSKHVQAGQSNSTLEDPIREKKLLLVLDDVRSLDVDTLVSIRNSSMFAGSSTIKVVITTRSKKLATTIYGKIPTASYELRAISDEDARTLFKKLGAIDDHPDKELNDLCWEMMKRSNNIPRTIMDLACLVQGEKKRKWKALMSADFSRLRDLREAYSLSTSVSDVTFRLLPSPLKRCFAYSALFQQNDKVKMQKLIHLWIAQGYVEEPALNDEDQTLEEVSEDYYRALQDWSFFKDHKEDFDLAKSIAANEMLAINFNCAEDGSVLSIVPYDYNGVYHLFISNTSSQTNACSDPSLSSSCSKLENWITLLPPQLRSFLKVQGSTVRLTDFCDQLFLRMSHLRALDLNSSDIIVVPASIALLKHLRYLNLSLNDFTKLPDSITTLAKLQVIDLSCCKELLKLPRHFSRLSSLRHLYLDGCVKLTGMPVGLGKMTALQTLNVFVVGNTKKSCTLDELSSLNLKSELTYRFASQPASSSKELNSKKLPQGNLV